MIGSSERIIMPPHIPEEDPSDEPGEGIDLRDYEKVLKDFPPEEKTVKEEPEKSKD